MPYQVVYYFEEDPEPTPVCMLGLVNLYPNEFPNGDCTFLEREKAETAALSVSTDPEYFGGVLQVIQTEDLCVYCKERHENESELGAGPGGEGPGT